MCLDTWYEKKSGYTIYLENWKPTWNGAWKLPKCDAKCEKLRNNDYCDPDCNSLQCLWDGNDCDAVIAQQDKIRNNCPEF